VSDAGLALRGAVFHYARLLANGPGLAAPVGAALDAAPGERVLDLGCGCGSFAAVVPGEYVGIDHDPRYIAFARRRFGGPGRRFECRDLAELEGRETFDKAIMASVLHHLPDADAAAVLVRLVAMVRRRLVVMDLDPETSNPLRAFLIRHDRGRFVRPASAQRALLASAFRVVDERRFVSAFRTGAHTLFVCESGR
jgi:2-polyprenyl-3-methyl-5-hydroxy-6-metoxy-1,4-benzoquinol methylase